MKSSSSSACSRLDLCLMGLPRRSGLGRLGLRKLEGLGAISRVHIRSIPPTAVAPKYGALICYSKPLLCGGLTRGNRSIYIRAAAGAFCKDSLGLAVPTHQPRLQKAITGFRAVLGFRVQGLEV